MKKKLGLLIVFFTLLQASVVFGEESSANACGYEPGTNENPDFQTMNCLLTGVAMEFDVPPEIVKAIAEGESGDWKQFDENGNPVIASDGGIGVMQVTNKSQYDQELLKTDILYNIQAGVETLDQMFSRNDLPVINDGDREVIENWYFAVMAYNGTKPVNSPIVKATGARNTDAYQEKIFRIIENYNLVDLAELPFKSDEFSYDSTSDSNIQFNTMQYNFTLPLTTSKHEFKMGHKVGATTAVNVRPEPTTTNTTPVATLRENEIVEVTGPFVYDSDPTKKNHFVWYPIKRSDGTKGYVASSYIEFRFNDVKQGHYAEDEIYYLRDRRILEGVGNGKFGMAMDISRWQVVLLLTRANHTSLENRPDPGFSDVPKSHKYYNEIAAAVDEGLFKGISDTEFAPDKTMTRAEMAEVLQRLFQFPESSKQHSFTDLTRDWYKDSVSRLYGAGITEGINTEGTKFGPNLKVTREQFAVFLVRAMDEEFRK